MPRENREQRAGEARKAPSGAQSHEHEEEQLDEALEETFPSSDPVAVSVPSKETEWTAEELAEAERKEHAPDERGPRAEPRRAPEDVPKTGG